MSKRRTASKRLRRTKKSVWRWGRSQRQAPLQDPSQQWCQKGRGHFQGYGIRGNVRLLEAVGRFVEKAWRYGLSRRSTASSIGGAKFAQLMQTSVLPTPRIVHTI